MPAKQIVQSIGARGAQQFALASHEIHPYEECKPEQTSLFATVSQLCQYYS